MPKLLIAFFVLSSIFTIYMALDEKKKEEKKFNREYYTGLLSNEERYLSDISMYKIPGNTVSCSYLNMDEKQGEIQALCTENKTGKSCIITLQRDNDWKGCDTIRE